MVPFFILVGAFILLRGIGWLGVKPLKYWRTSGRYALVIMFFFTGATHFTGLKYDYAAMIPAPLPNDLWVIYLTGIFEIAGAMGLLIPQTRRIAAIALILLLFAMLPANISAAIQEVPFQGRAATPLWIRLPMQLFFIWMIWWSTLQGND